MSYLRCTLLAAILLAPAWAAEIRTPTYSSPPKYFLENGKVKGLCIDVVHAIEKIEPSIKFVGLSEQVPLPRIEAGVEGNEYDLMLCVSKTPERLAKFTVIDTPIFVIREQLIVRANDPVDAKSFDDVIKLGADNKVLAWSGTSQAQRASKQLGQLADTSAYTLDQLFAKLAGKRGRFIYLNETTAINYIKNNHLEKEVRILPVPIVTEGRYFMFSKKMSPDLIGKVSAALEKLSSNGELKKIAGEYILE